MDAQGKDNPGTQQSWYTAPDHSTFLRLVRANKVFKSDLIFKAVLLFLSTSVFIFWNSLDRDPREFRYLTMLSSTGGMITRGLCLIELLLRCHDQHRLKVVSNTVQIVMADIHAVVLTFYWAILAYPAFAGGLSPSGQFNTVLLHLVTPVCSFLPVIFERTDHFHKQLIFILIPVCILYLTFMGIYVSITNEPIYSVMTFKNGWTAVYGLAAVGLGVGYFYLGWWIAKKLEARHKALSGPVSPSLRPNETQSINTTPNTNNEMVSILARNPNTSQVVPMEALQKPYPPVNQSKPIQF